MKETADLSLMERDRLVHNNQQNTSNKNQTFDKCTAYSYKCTQVCFSGEAIMQIKLITN